MVIVLGQFLFVVILVYKYLSGNHLSKEKPHVIFVGDENNCVLT